MAEKTPQEYDTQLPFGTRKPQGGPVVVVQPTRRSQETREYVLVDTVDGSEIRWSHQLRLVVLYHYIYIPSA